MSGWFFLIHSNKSIFSLYLHGLRIPICMLTIDFDGIVTISLSSSLLTFFCSCLFKFDLITLISSSYAHSTLLYRKILPDYVSCSVTLDLAIRAA
jgi:hypothetical protein